VNALNRLTRTPGVYAYLYAEPADVGPRAPLQLEFWVPKGRKGGAWIPQHLTFGLTGFSKAWRKVRPGHSHADKLAHSIRMREYAPWRSRFDQCQAYCAHARAAGLKTVTIFAGDAHGIRAALEAGLQYVEVDPAEFTGPAPIAEECDE
jgi:hypothetical protein